jgi:hypothetical protein
VSQEIKHGFSEHVNMFIYEEYHFSRKRTKKTHFKYQGNSVLSPKNLEKSEYLERPKENLRSHE